MSPGAAAAESSSSSGGYHGGGDYEYDSGSDSEDSDVGGLSAGDAAALAGSGSMVLGRSVLLDSSDDALTGGGCEQSLVAC